MQGSITTKQGERTVYWTIFFGTIIAGSALLALCFYWIGLAIKKQAQKPVKKFFAPIPRPGSYSFVSNEGRIVDILENVVTWNLKLDTESGRRLFYPGNHKPTFLEEKLGVRWIWFYPTIRVFKDFEWAEIQERQVDKDGEKVVKYDVATRKEDVTDFFFQFSHPVRTEAIEIKGNTQVVITMLITVLNLDPERAQFLNKDPAVLLAGIIQSTVRAHICDLEFDDIKKLRGTALHDKQEGQELWNAIKSLNGLEMEDGKPDYKTEDPLGVFAKLGKYMIRCEIMQVDNVGDAAKAIEAERIAELKGKAAVATAKKEAEAAVEAARGRMEAAELDAIAQRKLNEQTAGYFASLPGGARMFAAAQVAGKNSSVSTWVEGKSDIDVALPLPSAPPPPTPPEKPKK